MAAFLYFDIHPHWFFIPGGSAPQGLWRIVGDDGRSTRELGQWVVVCPPLNAVEHRQLFNDEPPNEEVCTSQLSLKQIAALPGDRVIVDFPHVVTPLRAVEAVDLDKDGEQLPRPLDGVHWVAEDTYWVLTQDSRSVDSRYYGPVAADDILKTAQPILTIR